MVPSISTYPRSANTSLALNTTLILPSNETGISASITKTEQNSSVVLLDKIPGYKWLRTKLGKLFKGPTYGMSAEELEEHEAKEARERYIEHLRDEKEKEFKVAKFMALFYPEYYWNEYIQKFEKGTPESKIGVFIFVLLNKQAHGKYYSPNFPWHKDYVEAEFNEMGINIDGDQSIIRQYLNKYSGLEMDEIDQQVIEGD
jgi:hypothetical protein